MSQKFLSVVLIAGGLGMRMKSKIPKQFLPLCNKPIARHSFDLFLSMPNVSEIVVVCDPQYHSVFSEGCDHKLIRFAQPGERRQDSVFNGFQRVSNRHDLVCIHDSARPLITSEIVKRVFEAAHQYGAAAAAMPVKGTIKICDGDHLVASTPARTALWEMQTPQIILYDLMSEGFKEAQKRRTTVTDDVALVELLGHPVKIVEGAYTNLKVTTPEDLLFAEVLMEKVCTTIS